MDYEKAYKDALERAKEIKGKILQSHLSTESCKAISEYIDTIIPELAESEDERIIRELIEHIESNVGHNPGLDRKEGRWIAWLEKRKEQNLIMANSPQLKEQKPVMIQWTGKNLKEVIDFTGKSPKFGEWFKSWEDFENYVHSHYDILKLFCEDGSHYEVPVGAWIVKTPDGYNTPSVFRFIQKPVAQEGTAVRGPEPYGPIHFDQS